MLRNKKLIFLLPICLMLVMAVGISVFALRRPSQSFVTPDASEYETTSNRQAQAEPDETKVLSLGTEGYELKMENARLAVWYREEVHGIRIVDKQSGYVWGSIEGDEVEGLNKKWSQTANAICVFEYFDEKYNEKNVPLSDSSVKVKEKWTENQATFKVSVSKADLKFEFTMSLLEDGINFSVDDSTISEDDEGMLKSINFVPFLGASLQDSVSGYIFIPDGSGALMRFSKSDNYMGGYAQRVYGQDMGIDQLTQVNDLVSTRTNDYLVDGASISIPVFGVVHGVGQNAIMSVIDSGAEYAQIEAIPAGVVTDYNRVSCNFDYRQMYTHPVGKDSGGVYRPQADMNEVNASLSIHLLSGEEASYSGMAVKYREMLIADEVLSEERTDKEIPLRLDVVGSEIADGQLFDYAKTFTTVEETEEILDSLEENGIKNISLFYLGWQKGGINGASYGETSYNRKLGSKNDFAELSERVAQNGGYFYLTENVLTGNKDQVNLQSQVAQQISKEYQAFSRSNKYVMYSNYYVVKANKLLETLADRSEKKDTFGRSFGELGYRLYSDYTKSAKYTRDEFKASLIEAISEQKNRVALNAPNDYLWKYTDDYLDIPMNNNQYLYETDTVPFLQIVLKGSMDYYAPYANQSGYSKMDILKMVEYGAYPSFIVAAADNYELEDTPLVDYFSINFKDWEKTIHDVYREVSTALNAVEGAYIEAHKVLETGVVRVDYSSGVSIYINYNNQEYQSGEFVVPASSYVVEERGEANENKK